MVILDCIIPDVELCFLYTNGLYAKWLHNLFIFLLNCFAHPKTILQSELSAY